MRPRGRSGDDRGVSILHLAFRDDWDAALASGSYPWSTRGATIEDVGFLHACHDRAQLAGVAGRFYADVTAPLLVLELDEARLAAAGLEVRDEPGRPGDADAERFPHVYGGPLPADVVVAATPWRPERGQ